MYKTLQHKEMVGS